jgi:hypothetical protein
VSCTLCHCGGVIAVDAMERAFVRSPPADICVASLLHAPPFPITTQEDEEINLEAYDVPLREWIAEDRTRREVRETCALHCVV